jgi:hypothetical protein
MTTVREAIAELLKYNMDWEVVLLDYQSGRKREVKLILPSGEDKRVRIVPGAKITNIKSTSGIVREGIVL